MKKIESEGEFYISRVYKEMLKSKEVVFGVLTEGFHCVGTPFQLFDLDNTLVSYPEHIMIRQLQKKLRI